MKWNPQPILTQFIVKRWSAVLTMRFLLLWKGIFSAQRNMFSVCISSSVLSYEKQPAGGNSTDLVCWLLDEPSLHAVKEPLMLGQILSPVLNSTLQSLFCFLHGYKLKSQCSQLFSFCFQCPDGECFWSSKRVSSTHPSIFQNHLV